MMIVIRTHKLIFLLLLWLVPLALFGAQSGDKKNGFRLSNSTYFHLGLGFVTEYESNITQASTQSFLFDVTNNNRKDDFTVGDMVLHIQPNTRLVVDDSYKTVGMSVFFDYKRYMGLQDSSAASKMSQLDLNSDILGEFNKEGNFIFSFKNIFNRESAPRSQELTGYHSSLLETFYLAFHMRNSQKTMLLKISPGVEFRYFEESSYQDYRYVSPKMTIYGRWNFLPKTALFFNISVRYQDYYESFMRDQVRTVPFNMFVGINGQITAHFSLRLSAGYSGMYGEDMHHDVNAGVELVYKRFDKTLLSLGYTRAIAPAAFYEYIRNDRLYFKAKQRFGRVWMVQLDTSYSFVAYGESRQFDDTTLYTSTGNPLEWNRIGLPNGAAAVVEVSSLKKKVQSLKVKPSFMVNATKWFGIKLSYEFRWDNTDYFRKGDYRQAAQNINTRYETYYDFMDHRVMLDLILDY
ncbi:hypothetical protein KAH37_04360 [bacterium]|nr:hypothetical protein [bacterium]